MYPTIDGQHLRKYTLGPYGVRTLISARTAAQKVLLARLDGQDPAAEKQSRRKRPVGLEIGEVVQQYKLEYLEPREIGLETVRILDRIVLPVWKGHQITGISRGAEMSGTASRPSCSGEPSPWRDGLSRSSRQRIDFTSAW